MTPTVTQGHCPTPQNSPTYLVMNVAAVTPAKPHRTEIQGILPDKRRIPHRWPTCLKKQPPRAAFKNNDIYMIDDKESYMYVEPKERNLRVMYKLKVSEDPTSKNMPHEEEFDDDNYESIEEKETAVWRPPILINKTIFYVWILVYRKRVIFLCFWSVILLWLLYCCKDVVWMKCRHLPLNLKHISLNIVYPSSLYTRIESF